MNARLATAEVTAADLRGVAIFEHFDEDALADLARRCTVRRYAKGDVVWRAGDAGDELLVVVAGELEVFGPDDDVIARAGVGECVGELALLLGDRRSATVTCSVAATTVVLAKAAFDDVVRDHRVLALLTAAVSRRVVALTEHRPVARRLVVVGVVADPGVPGASLVAASIAALARTTLGRRVVISAADEIETTAPALRMDARDAHLAVIDLPPTVGIARARAACDFVVRVTGSAADTEDPQVLTVVNRHRSGSPALPLNSSRPFVLPDEPSLAGMPLPDAVDHLLASPHLAIRAPLDRLVRSLLGVTVGIALGGGAAFGIAHLGVLLALEEAGIVPDIYAGTSMGSVVALAAASGTGARELAEIAGRIGTVRTSLSVLDPAVDGSGLLGGRRMARIFAPLMAAERFDELVRPCRVVATDINSGDRVDIGVGRLDDAFRASCSIPLIFSPVTADGRTLVDGAMVDPVPAEVARAMGADIVIAVNVVPRLSPGSTTAISRTLRTVNRLNPLSYRKGAKNLPHVVDVLMNSLQVIQYELGNFRALAADVRINVDLAGFTWIEFHRAAEIIERGRAAGEAALPSVLATIAGRLDG